MIMYMINLSQLKENIENNWKIGKHLQSQKY